MSSAGRSLSVRARITLWNVGVMALVLAVLGVTLRYTVHAYLIASIDRELTGRYERLREAWKRRTPDRDEAFWRGPREGNGNGRNGRSSAREEGRSERERPVGDPRDATLAPTPPSAATTTASPTSGASPGAASTPQTPSPPARWRVLAPDGEPYFQRFANDPDQHLLDPAGLRVAARGQVVAYEIEREGEPVRVLSAPLFDASDRVIAVVQYPFALADIYRGLGAVTLILVVLMPIALLAAGLGGAFLTERALRPVREVTDAASQIEAENLSGRLPVQGDDEFAALSRTFNAMLERLEAAFNRQRRFTADASHELRTPLSVIKASTSLALDSPRSGEEYRAILETIDPAADRMERIVRDLLFLARSDGREMPVERQPVLVRHLLEDAVREVRPFGDGRGAAMVIEAPDPDLVMEADAHPLHRLIVNLLENADRHTPATGRITVSARPDGDAVLLSVADTGEGIPPEHLPHVFEQFYRVDPARSRAAGGAGLGLAICKAIVAAHGGSIDIESRVGEGTTVTARIPGRIAVPQKATA
jgi:Signal transduction histidine kinase